MKRDFTKQSSKLTRENVDFFHSLNMDNTFRVNSPENLERILPFGLDTITYDAPDIIIPLLRERDSRPSVPQANSALPS